MVIETGDTVWYVWQDNIYKGVVTEDIDTTDALFTYCRVKTQFGLQIMADYQLYPSREALVYGITHESAQIWY